MNHLNEVIIHETYRQMIVKNVNIARNFNGTGGRNRTDTPMEQDFESCASTSSATPASKIFGV